eukprot:11061979-Alexandrium_andersonii.AAC.1
MQFRYCPKNGAVSGTLVHLRALSRHLRGAAGRLQALFGHFRARPETPRSARRRPKAYRTARKRPKAPERAQKRPKAPEGVRKRTEVPG